MYEKTITYVSSYKFYLTSAKSTVRFKFFLHIFLVKNPL